MHRLTRSSAALKALSDDFRIILGSVSHRASASAADSVVANNAEQEQLGVQHFAAVQASKKQHRKVHQCHSCPASFAVLMLAHSAGCPNADVWAEWRDRHAKSRRVQVFAHVKRGVQLSAAVPGHAFLQSCRLRTAVDSKWGDVSLVEAFIRSLGEILGRCPGVQHIALVSGHDVPLQLVGLDMLSPGITLTGLYEFGQQDMQLLQKEVQQRLAQEGGYSRQQAQQWGKVLTFHHQWLVVSREHAQVLVENMDEVLQVGCIVQSLFTEFDNVDMAPDEFLILTALKYYGAVIGVVKADFAPPLVYPPGTLVNCYPTAVQFPDSDSPHPVTWTSLTQPVKYQRLDQHNREQQVELNLRSCLHASHDALFFRKVQVQSLRQSQQKSNGLLSTLRSMWRQQQRRQARRRGTLLAKQRRQQQQQQQGQGQQKQRQQQYRALLVVTGVVKRKDSSSSSSRSSITVGVADRAVTSSSTSRRCRSRANLQQKSRLGNCSRVAA